MINDNGCELNDLKELVKHTKDVYFLFLCASIQEKREGNYNNLNCKFKECLEEEETFYEKMEKNPQRLFASVKILNENNNSLGLNEEEIIRINNKINRDFFFDQYNARHRNYDSNILVDLMFKEKARKEVRVYLDKLDLKVKSNFLKEFNNLLLTANNSEERAHLVTHKHLLFFQEPRFNIIIDQSNGRKRHHLKPEYLDDIKEAYLKQEIIKTYNKLNNIKNSEYNIPFKKSEALVLFALLKSDLKMINKNTYKELEDKISLKGDNAGSNSSSLVKKLFNSHK